jgi:hypothetical protein
MSRIQIENGYTLCIIHRQPYTHLLLEQTLSDGSTILHGEKKLENSELEAFLAFGSNSAKDIQEAFRHQKA